MINELNRRMASFRLAFDLKNFREEKKKILKSVMIWAVLLDMLILIIMYRVGVCDLGCGNCKWCEEWIGCVKFEMVVLLTI